MKGSSKYLLAAGAITLIMTLLCAAVCITAAAGIKNAEYQAELSLIASLREKYPELDDGDIIDVLSADADTKSAAAMLRSYGFTNDRWTIVSNEGGFLLGISGCTAVCLLTGGALILVLLLYMRREKKRTLILTEYLSKLNHGQYDLDIGSNSEEEFSLLKNEIYRTTVTLREKSERYGKDKLALKDGISDISHQLKTPLTSIQIMTDGLIEDENMSAKERREFLFDIRRSTSHIIFLVQSLLTLSRLDADAITMKSDDVPLIEIMDVCREKTEILAEVRNVNIIFGNCRDISITGDKKWMAEAASNIVKNCIEHTPDGGRVRVSAKQNKLFTCIRIEDNGCGIPKEELPHIFDRFFRGSTSDENSVGIGLSLSRAIIEKHNGFIRAESEPGKGTSFEIRLMNSIAAKSSSQN